MHKDYYKILGASKADSIEKIKKSFYKLAHKLHPDKGGNPVEFIEAQEAYAVLTNPVKREEYDKLHNLKSFIEYNDFGPDKSTTKAKKQRTIVLKFDKERNGWVYKGNKMVYDRESGTWRFGDVLS